MRKRSRRISPAQQRRLALAGFVCGGVFAVLVNQNATGQSSKDMPAKIAAQAEGPVELGRVDWLRDYEAGVARAEETGRPMLLLFQEVPG